MLFSGQMFFVGDLNWVAEILFPWGDKPCHPICLYYDVGLIHDNQIPLEGMYMRKEQLEGRNFEMYPTNITELLKRYDEGIQHFVYREE